MASSSETGILRFTRITHYRGKAIPPIHEIHRDGKVVAFSTLESRMWSDFDLYLFNINLDGTYEVVQGGTVIVTGHRRKV